MKKKLIVAGIIVLIVGLSIVYYFTSRFKYNEEGTVGNTAGNLYNEGLFCENNGYVYFANPYDDYKLYKMDIDGENVEKLYSDTVSDINVAGGYIYYTRFNHKSGADVVFTGTIYGVFRLKDGDSMPVGLHSGVSNEVTLCGNYIFYQSYNDKDVFELRKVKIDGKEDTKISDKAYIPSSVSNGNIYFPEVEGNHNLLRLNTQTGSISTYKEGNFYMPIICNNYIYYIDLDNDRKLCRMNMSNEEVDILSEDKCVNYNLSEEQEVIFYQTENSTSDHRLMKMDINGDNITTIREGDCFNISITSKYTYFIEKIGDSDFLYRMNTAGVSIPERYYIEVKE